jgi:uncharacterized membrane protein YuzA (DUF378 family)
MTTRRMLIVYAIVGLAVSLPFVFIHFNAKPNDAPITPLQHITAAVANFFGPWGGPIVRLVDFPNAGLRSFSWALSVGMTVFGVVLILFGAQAKPRLLQYGLITLWTVFTVVWFGVGLGQIADGLL